MDTQVRQIELATIVLHGGTAPVIGVLKKETDKDITLGFAASCVTDDGENFHLVPVPLAMTLVHHTFGKDAATVIPKSNVLMYSKFQAKVDTPHPIGQMFVEFWGAGPVGLAPEAEKVAEESTEQETELNTEPEAEQETEPEAE
jgi:hypothetical protein